MGDANMSTIAPFCIWFKGLFHGWSFATETTIMLLVLVVDFFSIVVGRNLRIPHWLPLTAAVILFVHLSYRMWRREWERAERNQAIVTNLRTALGERCSDLAKRWTRLQDEATTTSIPDPLKPTWSSSTLQAVPYKVGVCQGLFQALEADLSLATIPKENTDDIRSIGEAILVLGKYQKRIEKL